MWGRTAGVSIAGSAFVLLVAGTVTGGGLNDTGLADDAAAIATHLDPRVRDTLARIPDLGRRLLALRSYLRAGSTLPARWSWSEQEIRDFEQSQEFCDAQAEVDRVVTAFAAAFPGYTLYVNREVRSLDVQIERWNSNASVDAASRTLLDDLHRASAQRAPGEGAAWLKDSLTGWTLAVPVTLAAPGLSAHGQSRAFDFQVEHDGTIVAGDPFKDRIFKLRLLELTRSCRLDSEHDAMEPIEETASAVSANVRSDGRLAQLDRALA